MAIVFRPVLITRKSRWRILLLPIEGASDLLLEEEAAGRYLGLYLVLRRLLELSFSFEWSSTFIELEDLELDNDFELDFEDLEDFEVGDDIDATALARLLDRSFDSFPSNKYCFPNLIWGHRQAKSP